MIYKRNFTTRQRAVAIAGDDLVALAESDNCEPTSREMYPHETDYTEWAGSAQNDTHRVTVYYYTTDEDDSEALDTGDWSNVDWVNRIVGYTVEEVEP